MPDYYSYYPVNNLLNSIYALNIAIESHFGNLLLEGDLGRIVYASNDFALRRWAENKARLPIVDNTGNPYNLPFFNYKLKSDGYTNGTNRAWFSNAANTYGIWAPDLGKKIRMLNVTLAYEATLFVMQDIDSIYTATNMLWDDSNETILDYYLQIDSQAIKNIAVLNYDMDFQDRFNETDWLEKNNIRTVGFDFSFETFIILENADIQISEEVALTFYNSKFGPFTDINAETKEYMEAFQTYWG
ncbi:MAG: hypothetical protein GF311_28210 [Candidatus Lokiarchaeota archaeon]|nr:hypothetical protein [Candidatus Lokiarchaeota archaeon]